MALILLAAVLALVLMRRIGRGQFVEGSNGPVFLRHSHARLAAVTASAARFARLSHLVESRINSPAVMLESEARAAREKLRELALDHLRQIRYQQSFSRERSIAVKVGGAPIGVDVDGKRGETWQERPKSYPELVAELRTFIAAVAEKYVVVIGVDELDKLRSPDAVEHFLNDIKGVFGATGCFFLVSVSEEPPQASNGAECHSATCSTAPSTT